MPGRYQEVFRRSLDDPEAFWGRAASRISWIRPPERVLDRSADPFTKWYPDGVLNTCHNALDRHVEAGRADVVALVYDSPVTGSLATFTYRELRDRVARLAGALADLGVEKGDTVVIYMPMIPETAMAMLACARLGAVHSVVFGGFAPQELAQRIDHARPKLLLTAAGAFEAGRVLEYKPLVDRALELAKHQPDNVVVCRRRGIEAVLKPPRDVDWDEAVRRAAPAPCTPVAATDPLYILYTSGTTAAPKGIVRDNGGHAVALHWSMEHVYDVRPRDVFWAASDVGWVVGHSYIVYGPLFLGATSVLYEGKPVGTPDPGAFWRVASQHRVRVLFTAPTALRAIKKEDPEGKHVERYDLLDFKYLFLAGERLDPDTYHWARRVLKRPVIDHWWQTESGWPMAANCMGLQQLIVKPGSPTVPVPGWDVRVLRQDGSEADPHEEGAVVAKLPLPPGALSTLYRAEDRYVDSYLSRFDGWYLTGDGGYRDEDGYLFVMGRTDDVINVSGHRLSTGGIEEVLARHPDVAECAVVGAADPLKGQVPVGLVVLKAGVDRPEEEIQHELVASVRAEIGAIACYRETAVVARLPKTRSGKILRGTMRRITDGKEYAMPSTIEDPSVLDEVAEAFQRLGYPRRSL